MIATETQRKDKAGSRTGGTAFSAPLECGCGSQMNIRAVHASVMPDHLGEEPVELELRGCSPRSPGLASQHHAHSRQAGGLSARTSWHLGGQWLGFQHTLIDQIGDGRGEEKEPRTAVTRADFRYECLQSYW